MKFDDGLKTDKQREKALKLREKIKAQIYFDSLTNEKKSELIKDLTETRIFEGNQVLKKNFLNMSFRNALENEMVLDYISMKKAR